MSMLLETIARVAAEAERRGATAIAQRLDQLGCEIEAREAAPSVTEQERAALRAVLDAGSGGLPGEQAEKLMPWASWRKFQEMGLVDIRGAGKGRVYGHQQLKLLVGAAEKSATTVRKYRDKVLVQAPPSEKHDVLRVLKQHGWRYVDQSHGFELELPASKLDEVAKAIRTTGIEPTVMAATLEAAAPFQGV